ncbi:phosphoenolpyruvate--protein phosphotransferase [Actinokineospora soli]|uniref:Phosphoenolpyruvate-protein phosphotransferase n=1 Tax=Actinokineospora soli TaxID=1048753 RepID=A0ABW2TLC8_9PSEU
MSELEGRAEGLSGELRDIMETQVMMARDPALAAGIRSAVDRGLPAAWAVHEAFGVHLDALSAIGGYLGERAADLADLRDRTVAVLLGLPRPGLPGIAEPYVLVATDLAPADTVVLDPARVLAIVTEKGGPTSHTAIVARALGIPAVVSCPSAADLPDGTRVIVDGTAGSIEVDPSDEVVTAARDAAEARARALAAHTGPGRTADGHPVALLLNVGSGDPGGSIDAEGIGLFRTEFLFLDRTTAPTFDEQRTAYANVFAHYPGRPVTIRTLDAGADKPLRFATHPDEPNPALGIRGYRTTRHHPDLLTTQLSAIASAAAAHTADVRVMAPMIATPTEAATFADAARSAGIPSVGVMIEIPAAALRAEAILAEVDFVSIGTNDLSQYTFAADRQLGDLADLLDPHQPALLTLIAMVAKAGASAGKPVGVCGEAAADPTLARIFTGLGVTSLSMSAPAIPTIRAALHTTTHAECVALAHRALT